MPSATKASKAGSSKASKAGSTKASIAGRVVEMRRELIMREGHVLEIHLRSARAPRYVEFRALGRHKL